MAVAGQGLLTKGVCAIKVHAPLIWQKKNNTAASGKWKLRYGVMLARSDCLVCAQSAHASGYLQGAGVRQRVPGGVDILQFC